MLGFRDFHIVPAVIAACGFAFIEISVAELIQDWDFSEKNWQGKELKDRKSGLRGICKSAPIFKDSSLIVNEECFVSVPEISAADLPGGSFTVAARVSLEKGQRWGNFAGFFQDNGSYERGWSLGYNDSKFVFWISTGGRLISISSKRSFKAGEWADLAGVFDGKKIRLYVNGELSSETDAVGKIAYPDEAQFVMGAYLDKDEFYPMQGRFAKVLVYDSALTESEIRRAAGLPVRLDFTVQPALQFMGTDKARVFWTTENPSKGRVEYGPTEELGMTVEASQESHQSGSSEVVLTGLDPQSIYFYRIVDEDDARSPIYEFNTALNFNPPPTETAVPSQLALKNNRIEKGYAVVFGANTDLIVELVKQSGLIISAFDTDEERVTAVRKKLYQNGNYGSRATIMKVEDLASLPVTSCFADLVFCEPAPSDELKAEIQRVLIPGRGIAYAGSKFLSKKPVVEESGSWTHQYGDAANTASSSETLSGARATSDLTVQWFGRPGADFGLDRNPRMPAPLAVNGRLFHQGMNRLVALNAANGACLWSLEIPEFQRVNIPRDSSNWCADSKNLYVAVKDRAWILNGETGKRRTTLPPLFSGNIFDHDWGYIGRAENFLIGSATKPKSSYREHWTKRMWFDGKAGAFGTAQVCSDALFAYDLESLIPAWQYQNGILLNPTIAVSGNRIIFVESRHPALKKLNTSQISMPELWLNQFLVALDLQTGKVIWERPIDTEDGQVSFYLQVASGTILLTASNTAYHLYAFSLETGKPIWNHSSPWPDDHHSGHIQHPVIVDGTIYLQPNGFDLLTGKQVTTKVGKRSGCHTYIGTKNALIYRGEGRQVAMWDRADETITTWPRLRPSCWLSLIPANGMLLVPEGGGGCSCGGWMETSIGFAPLKLLGGGVQ